MGDFTGDGAADIALANTGSDTIAIYLQQTTTTTNTSTFTYDSLNRQITSTDALGNTTTILYDAAGNVTGVDAPLSQTTTYLVDSLNRTSVTIDPSGAATTTLFDKIGQATQVTAPGGSITRYSYDPLGRLTKTTTGFGTPQAATSINTYDPDGNLTKTAVPQYSDGTSLVSGTPVSLGTGQPAGIAAGDFNNDGNQDFAVVNYPNTGVNIFLGNGDGAFHAPTPPSYTVGSGTGDSGVVVGDFNGDGKEDLAVTGSNGTDGIVAVLLGNGNGTFQGAVNYDLGSNDIPKGLAVADINGDGSPDLIVDASESGFINQSYVTVLLGNGNGTFGAPINSDISTNTENYSLAVADLNGDGKPDVVTTIGTHYVSVLLGNGDGTFGAATNIAVGNSVNRLVLGDFNNDGITDIAETNSFDSTVGILLGNGNGTFNLSTYSVATTPTSLAVADINGDGNQDLVVSSSSTGTVLLGNGNGTFSTGQTLAALADATSLAVADVNGDGASDVLAAQIGGIAGDVLPVLRQTQHNSVTTNTFNSRDLQVTTTNPVGAVTSTLYDANANITELIDGAGNTTSYAYDALNRVTSQTSQLGSGHSTTTFAYNTAGLLISQTDALGRVEKFLYDALDRLTEQIWYQAGGTIVYDRLTSTYDLSGNLLTAANSAGTYTMQYDALNRVTYVSEPFSVALSFAYDALGNRKEVQDYESASLGATVTSLYNAINLLTSTMLTPAGTSTALEVDLTYNSAELLSSLSRSTWSSGTQTHTGTTSYLYDSVDRMTGINYYYAGGSTLGTIGYSYDNANELTSETDNGGTPTSYTYDASGQLTKDGSTTYAYDNGGNRTQAGTYTYGTAAGGNELTNDGTWTYLYDAVGNTTEKYDAAHVTWTYSYDNANHMLTAQEATSTGTVVQATYTYDFFGNLVKEVSDIGGTTTTQEHAYDMWNPANGGSPEVVLDMNGSNTVTTRYLRGNEVDQLFANYASSTTTWLLTDHLGSIRYATNSAGTSISATVNYDAWGNVNNSTSSNVSSAGQYLWTGRMTDAATGLQYNNARFYNPTTGNWTTQDPIGFAAGDSNLYRYVGNNPTNETDPGGLRWIYTGGHTPSDVVLGQRFDWVSGYTTNRGTQVAPYWRPDPNGRYVDYTFVAPPHPLAPRFRYVLDGIQPSSGRTLLVSVNPPRVAVHNESLEQEWVNDDPRQPQPPPVPVLPPGLVRRNPMQPQPAPVLVPFPRIQEPGLIDDPIPLIAAAVAGTAVTVEAGAEAVGAGVAWLGRSLWSALTSPAPSRIGRVPIRR